MFTRYADSNFKIMAAVLGLDLSKVGAGVATGQIDPLVSMAPDQVGRSAKVGRQPGPF